MLFRSLAAAILACGFAHAGITVSQGRAVLKAQDLERVIEIRDGRVRTVRLAVGGREMLAAAAREFSAVVMREASNRKPQGLRPGERANGSA